MIIFLWFILRILFFVMALIIVVYLIRSSKSKETFHTILNGLKEGLKGCGFNLQGPKYPVELYEWVAANDDEVCEDCLERASWPPMDIADWMKEGLPKTSEADTECGENCRCKLVLSKSEVPKQRNNKLS